MARSAATWRPYDRRGRSVRPARPLPRKVIHIIHIINGIWGKDAADNDSGVARRYRPLPGVEVVLTNEYVQTALRQSNLEDRVSEDRLGLLVGSANRELGTWGHSSHEVVIERVTPYFGDSQVLNWSLWCETCHVSHHALLTMPSSQSPGSHSHPEQKSPQR